MPTYSEFIVRTHMKRFREDEEASPSRNMEVADHLSLIARAYKTSRNPKDVWRVRTYTDASRTIRAFPHPIEFVEDVKTLRGIGESVGNDVREILSTGFSERLRRLQSAPDLKAIELLMKIHGVGMQKAHSLVSEGVRTPEEALRQKKLNAMQTVGAQYYRDFELKIPRNEVARIVQIVKESLPSEVLFTAAGSYRRGMEMCGDVDILLTTSDTDEIVRHTDIIDEVVRALMRREDVQFKCLTSSSNCVSFRGCIRLSNCDHEAREGHWLPMRRIDLKLIHPDSFAFALLHFTGSGEFNRGMRHHALTHHNLHLSEYGLARRGAPARESVLHATSERDIFEFLHIPFVEPSRRSVFVAP